MVQVGVRLPYCYKTNNKQSMKTQEDIAKLLIGNWDIKHGICHNLFSLLLAKNITQDEYNEFYERVVVDYKSNYSYSVTYAGIIQRIKFLQGLIEQ